MNRIEAIRNIILLALFIIGALCLIHDNSRVYGIITLFGAVLYLMWNGDNNDNDNGFYNLT